MTSAISSLSPSEDTPFRTSFSLGRSSSDRSFIVLQPARILERMSSARRALLALATLLPLANAGCGDDPPTQEMQQAQTAIESARTAGADEYDHEEFAGAQEALQHANEAVGQRDYR